MSRALNKLKSSGDKINELNAQLEAILAVVNTEEAQKDIERTEKLIKDARRVSESWINYINLINQQAMQARAEIAATYEKTSIQENIQADYNKHSLAAK